MIGHLCADRDLRDALGDTGSGCNRRHIGRCRGASGAREREEAHDAMAATPRTPAASMIAATPGRRLRRAQTSADGRLRLPSGLVAGTPRRKPWRRMRPRQRPLPASA